MHVYIVVLLRFLFSGKYNETNGKDSFLGNEWGVFAIGVALKSVPVNNWHPLERV
jgi:hypothetical protein